MTMLRPLLMVLLMLAIPFAGFAASVAPACAQQPGDVAAGPAQGHAHHDMTGMDDAHHAGMDHALPADGHDATADPHHCHCGCACADRCAGGGLVALTALRPDGAVLSASSESPALPATPSTRRFAADDLLRPPTHSA